MTALEVASPPLSENDLPLRREGQRIELVVSLSRVPQVSWSDRPPISRPSLELFGIDLEESASLVLRKPGSARFASPD